MTTMVYKPVTPDDVRAEWWKLRGLILAANRLIEEIDTASDEHEAAFGVIRSLRDQGDRFSMLVEAAADKTPVPPYWRSVLNRDGGRSA